MSGADGVVMLDHPRALEDGRFEKIAVEFILANFADVGGDLAPHVGDESDVPQCQVTAEFAEHVEIPSGDPAEPIVRDSMDVDDPGKLRPFLIPIGGFSPEVRQTTNAEACLHGGQEKCYRLQNLRVALCSVIESWGVDEGHRSPIENELIREFDIGST